MSKLDQALRGITIKKVANKPKTLWRWLTEKDADGKTGFDVLGDLADQLRLSARVGDDVCFRFEVNGSLYYLKTPKDGGVVFQAVRDKDPDVIESTDYSVDSCEIRAPVSDERRWKGLLEIALDFSDGPGNWTDLEATFNGRGHDGL